MTKRDDFADDQQDESRDEYEYHETDESSSDGTYCHSERQAEPLREQGMYDFDLFFRDCKGLSYIFLGSDVNTVVPHIVAALMVFDSIDRTWDGELLDRWLAREAGADVPDAPDPRVIAAVRERVDIMQGRGDDFVLIWHVAGGREVHVDCAGSLDDHLDNLAPFLAEEVRDLVDCHW